jgi:hypothetical protein
MKNLLWYVFNPNPGHAAYGDTWVLAALLACGALVVGSFLIRIWRRKLNSSVTKKLTKSWPSAAFWFGVTGLILMVCRVEGIQFLATRLLWIMWFALVVVFAFVQARIFMMRNYEVLPRIQASDPRAKYLPGRRRR